MADALVNVNPGNPVGNMLVQAAGVAGAAAAGGAARAVGGVFHQAGADAADAIFAAVRRRMGPDGQRVQLRLDDIPDRRRREPAGRAADPDVDEAAPPPRRGGGRRRLPRPYAGYYGSDGPPVFIPPSKPERFIRPTAYTRPEKAGYQCFPFGCAFTNFQTYPLTEIEPPTSTMLCPALWGVYATGTPQSPFGINISSSIVPLGLPAPPRGSTTYCRLTDRIFISTIRLNVQAVQAPYSGTDWPQFRITYGPPVNTPGLHYMVILDRTGFRTYFELCRAAGLLFGNYPRALGTDAIKVSSASHCHDPRVQILATGVLDVTELNPDAQPTYRFDTQSIEIELNEEVECLKGKPLDHEGNPMGRIGATYPFAPYTYPSDVGGFTTLPNGEDTDMPSPWLDDGYMSTTSSENGTLRVLFYCLGRREYYGDVMVTGEYDYRDVHPR